MLCSNCGRNEAAVYINKNVNGKVSSSALCRECAAKLKIGGLGLLSGLDLVGMLGAAKREPKEKPIERPLESTDPSKRCTACGRSFEEIASSGRVGCAVCYKSFAEELSATISGIHGTAAYAGKRPGRREPVIEPLEDIIKIPDSPAAGTNGPETDAGDLRQKLLDAVKAENYEEAARLRDMIRALEAKTAKEGE